MPLPRPSIGGLSTRLASPASEDKHALKSGLLTGVVGAAAGATNGLALVAYERLVAQELMLGQHHHKALFIQR